MDVETIVRTYVDKCKEREPIFINDIKVSSEYTAARAVSFNKLEKENKIKLYKKDIYYKPRITRFGELGINTNKLITRQYIKNDNDIKGYLTGPALWNAWKITTQVPNRIWIATNSTTKTIEIDELRIKLLQPKTVINNFNYELLQLLDVIDQLELIQDVNWDNYLKVLFDKIKTLNIEQLKYIITLTKYYKVFVCNFLGAILEIIFNEKPEYHELHNELYTLKTKANLSKSYKLSPKIKLKNAQEWGFY